MRCILCLILGVLWLILSLSGESDVQSYARLIIANIFIAAAIVIGTINQRIHHEKTKCTQKLLFAEGCYYLSGEAGKDRGAVEQQHAGDHPKGNRLIKQIIPWGTS